MALANVARRDGDAFQARQFWFYAADMLKEDGAVARLGFEAGPRGFDDLWIEYRVDRAPKDARGNPVHRDHVQCKWHASHGDYGFADLVEPSFINAESTSLLQRALQAQAKYAPEGKGSRFQLLSNWYPRRTDQLNELINTRSSGLRVDRLFGTKTDQSKMGEVRKTWRDHLSITEGQLESLAHTLSFKVISASPEEVRGWLNDRFKVAGLQIVPISSVAMPHDDIVFQWMAQGRNEFDRASLRDACADQGLLAEPKASPEAFGVKSFEHPIDRLEERCTSVLNLVPSFHDRFIRNDEDWATTLYPELRDFLLSAAKGADQLRLALDAHTTLAFAAGSVLHVKAGRDVLLEQRTGANRIWSSHDADFDPTWPTLKTDVVDLGNGNADLAVSVGLTHNIERDVRAFVEEQLPSVGKLLVCAPSSGAGQASVRGGHHASLLADSLCQTINETRVPGLPRMVHLFMAVPNAFSFYAGQRQLGIGRVTLYEFDFENMRSGTYTPSLTLPLS